MISSLSMFLCLQTIKDRLETHTAQIEKLHSGSPSTSSSLSKKEKKKMKELKKLFKNKKFDDDKVSILQISDKPHASCI